MTDEPRCSLPDTCYCTGREGCRGRCEDCGEPDCFGDCDESYACRDEPDCACGGHCWGEPDDDAGHGDDWPPIETITVAGGLP